MVKLSKSKAIREKKLIFKASSHSSKLEKPRRGVLVWPPKIPSLRKIMALETKTDEERESPAMMQMKHGAWLYSLCSRGWKPLWIQPPWHSMLALERTTKHGHTVLTVGIWRLLISWALRFQRTLVACAGPSSDQDASGHGCPGPPCSIVKQVLAAEATEMETGRSAVDESHYLLSLTLFGLNKLPVFLTNRGGPQKSSLDFLLMGHWKFKRLTRKQVSICTPTLWNRLHTICSIWHPFLRLNSQKKDYWFRRHEHFYDSWPKFSRPRFFSKGCTNFHYFPTPFLVINNWLDLFTLMPRILGKKDQGEK